MTNGERPIPAGGLERLLVHDLGRIPYGEALQRQRSLQRQVIDAREAGSAGPMHLLLLEHDPPVITVSRRPGTDSHLLANDAQLRAAGVEVHATDRGGDITYHGPGQLVAYPILDLNRLGLRLHGYMRWLEHVVIDTLAQFGLTGERDPQATGVWVRGERGVDPAKICAMGVRVSRWVTMHGLALNVTSNLEHFDLIIPCGLVGRSVTSMGQRLGENCPSLEAVKDALAERFRAGMVAPGDASRDDPG